MIKRLNRLLLRGFVAAVILASLGAAAVIGTYFYVAPQLPPIDALRDVKLQVPLRVYSSDGKLIAEFGEMRRTPLRYEQIPTPMVHAILAAEDDRFFEHPGVDYQGILRAAYYLVLTGEKGQGGSTITMQVARNFFLSSEKTYLRKVLEIFLALKIERELSKQQILELYLNKIYLGQRAYGIAAAAQVYYGQELSKLEVPQFAMLAGLPKAPSAYNPVVNPKRALLRRNYVLRRMYELGAIGPTEFQEYLKAPVTATQHSSPIEVEAPYVAEMARAVMLERFGENIYTAGYRVYTSVDSRLQEAANRSLRKTLLEYERRHGYRGPEGQVTLAAASAPEVEMAFAADAEPETQLAPAADTVPEAWAEALARYHTVGGLRPALVTAVAEKSATVYLEGDTTTELPWEAISWAAPYEDVNHVGKAPEKAADVLAVGDVIRLEPLEGGYRLAQLPSVSGALVSLRPDDGAVLALIGGFDFYQSKFNRVTQADRQPGSNFKPFIYSAALENGFTTASIINDAPVVFEDAKLEAEWRPENYSGRFFGPTRLREALVRSRNLVSIRLLRAMGIGSAVRHIARFGFDPKRLSRDLSLALGSSALTPLEVVRGYAVLANGGFLIEPYFISRIEDADGDILEQADPPVACLPCERELQQVSDGATEAAPAVQSVSADTAAADGETVGAGMEAEVPEEREPRLAARSVELRNVYLVTSMMQDVIRRGTGRRALALGRNDLAGKTGTSNDQRDAWFSGFNRDVVTTAWVGFDTPTTLGASEAGARAALPMWVKYMETALDGRPEHTLEQPPGLVTVRIDAETGQLSRADDPNAVFETFRAENVPEQTAAPVIADQNGMETPGAGITEQLF